MADTLLRYGIELNAKYVRCANFTLLAIPSFVTVCPCGVCYLYLYVDPF